MRQGIGPIYDGGGLPRFNPEDVDSSLPESKYRYEDSSMPTTSHESTSRAFRGDDYRSREDDDSLSRIAELIGFVAEKRPADYETGAYIDWGSGVGQGAQVLNTRRSLTEVIRDVLDGANGKSMSLPDLHDKIVSGRLYTVRSGADVSYNQVYGTIRKHPELFEVYGTRPQIVRLRGNAAYQIGDEQRLRESHRSGLAEDSSDGHDRDVVKWASTVPSETWFEMSHWAKVNGYLTGWERRLLFGLGLATSNRKVLTPKQARQGRRLYDILTRAGYRPSREFESLGPDRPR